MEHAGGTKMVLPQRRAQAGRAVQGRTNGQPLEHRRMKSGVEQHETGGKAAGIGLDAAHQDTLEAHGFEVSDELGWREIAMLDEHLVGWDQRLVGGGRLPPKLPLERRHCLVVPLDSRHRVHGRSELGYPFHLPLGRVEARLDVDNQECLFHEV